MQFATQAEGAEQEAITRETRAMNLQSMGDMEAMHGRAATALSTVQGQDSGQQQKPPPEDNTEAIARVDNIGALKNAAPEIKQQFIEAFKKGAAEGNDAAWDALAAKYNREWKLTGNRMIGKRTTTTAGAHVGGWTKDTGQPIGSDSRIKNIIKAISRKY